MIRSFVLLGIFHKGALKHKMRGCDKWMMTEVMMMMMMIMMMETHFISRTSVFGTPVNSSLSVKSLGL